MSRVAKNPITVPKGIEVQIDGQMVTVKGKKGVATHPYPKQVLVKLTTDKELKFEPSKKSKRASALAGTTRAIVNNMVHGVSKGFEKRLKLVGVGYRAQVSGGILNLTLGYSHPIHFRIPEDMTIETPSQTEIIVKGINKQRIGQVAAEIRAYRKPEPYKGKGIKYVEEVIVIKETKKK
jgi:large subunit ribosomal protein L6